MRRVVLGAVLVLALSLGVWAAAPSTASAFVGEGVVLNGAGDLTSAAKSIITNPTFLPENVGEAAAYGGAQEAGGAAAVMESAGVLPALGGSVLAFGVGAAVGTEICGVLGIEGCWDFSSDSADPGPPPGGEWLFASVETAGIPAYSWYWDTTDAGTAPNAQANGAHECPAAPAGYTYLLNAFEAETVCAGKPTGKFMFTYAVRSAMENRTLDYHAIDDPEISNTSHTAPSNWSEKLAGQMEGHEGDAAARVGEKIASKVGGSEVANPYATLTVPSCEGITAAACVEVLEELGLTPSVAYLGWGSAVIPEVDLEEPILSLEAQAERVQEVGGAGTKVVAGAEIEVEANPKLAGMPVIVPEDPAPGESAEAFRENRLAPQDPAWEVKPEVLGESVLDPAYNPDTVVRPSPKPGTRLDPELAHETTVQVNPSTAPPVAAGGPFGTGADCEASIGNVDFTPLNKPLGSKFPFGVFAFFVTWLGEWEAGEASAPEWTFTIIPAGVFGSEKGLHVTVDMAKLGPVVTICRTVFLLATFIGLLWFLATAAAKLQGDAS